MQQFLVIILVCAFWVFPKGSLTLEKLSILLLEYLAIGVDSLDILNVRDEVTQKAINKTLFGDVVICVISNSTILKTFIRVIQKNQIKLKVLVYSF